MASVIQPPNNGLITETAQQYYAGSQQFRGDAGNTAGQKFTTTFDTDLYLGSYDPTNVDYSLNNFKIYTSTLGTPGTWTEYTSAFTLEDNIITITGNPGASVFIVVQLKSLSGGKYGATDADKAFGEAVEDNYGGYQYIKLNDIVNNFLVGYVGKDKLIPNVKRSDVIFFAKRAMQEFSYDTLKSIKSSELNIPPSLTLVLPQDYVNYVRLSWIDDLGVKHIIYPTNNITISPYYTQLQDEAGIPTQDNFGNDTEGDSITQERWHGAEDYLINNNLTNDEVNQGVDPDWYGYGYGWGLGTGYGWGQRYGLEPSASQMNGWFNINERENKLSFSSNLSGLLVVFEYISDGLAYDLDSRVPKLAEDAMYSYILYSIIAGRINQPEYVVQRLKKDKAAKLKNAKIRLSNIKLDEIVQVMRNKSKWIKH
tara:strand:- start:497 stop:1771 length:1275 start_codon:yes stop_codon:yes gene_type:complete